MALPKFRDLDFGCASAEVEFVKRPALLVSGYLDERNFIARLTQGERFLVIGNKGCGKSSIGKHLELKAQTDPHLFVTNLAIADLSYKTLRVAVTDDVEDRVRYPRVWAWLILITMLASLRKDNGMKHEDMAAFDQAAKTLNEHGLLPLEGLSPSLTRLRELGISALGFGLSGKGAKEAGVVSISTINEVLKDLLVRAETNSKHLIVIDGLDDVLLDSEMQLEAISALIYECAKLNEFFLSRCEVFNVVVLCRADIYSRLPGPNLNKIKQDLSLLLDWYFDSNEVSDSPLIHLANKKARVAYPDLPDVFDTYFPSDVKGKPIRKWLLEYTRSRPRDFLQLLTFIKDNCAPHEMNRGTFFEGLRKYSQDYFIPEVKNDLFGFAARSTVEAMFRLIQHMHMREFSFDALRQMQKKYDTKGELADLDSMCSLLYDAGAIGNVFYTTPRLKDGRSFPRFTFKHRSPESSFNRLDTITVHPAIRSGLRLT